LGYTPDEAFEDSIKNKITMTVYSLETAQKINEIAKSLGEKAWTLCPKAYYFIKDKGELN
ncbi:hypothetical protein ACTPEF_25250, partial [Clostridioides difficile]